MSTLSYGNAKIADAKRIAMLFTTVYVATYAKEGISFEFANFISERFSTAQIEKTISQHPEQLVVAYCNGNPVGVAEIHYQSNCKIVNRPSPELGKLYVLSAFHGKGVGSALLKTIEEKLQGKGYTSLWLEVYTKNMRADTFYKRQGYRTLGQVDFPMEENTYRNNVMLKEWG